MKRLTLTMEARAVVACRKVVEVPDDVTAEELRDIATELYDDAYMTDFDDFLEWKGGDLTWSETDAGPDVRVTRENGELLTDYLDDVKPDNIRATP